MLDTGDGSPALNVGQKKKKKTKNLKPIIIYIYTIDKTNLVVSGM